MTLVIKLNEDKMQYTVNVLQFIIQNVDMLRSRIPRVCFYFFSRNGIPSVFLLE
jgi:hypothetical protein